MSSMIQDDSDTESYVSTDSPTDESSGDDYAPSDEDQEIIGRGRPTSPPSLRSRASAPVNFNNAGNNVISSPGWSNKQIRMRKVGGSSRTRVVTSDVSISRDEYAPSDENLKKTRRGRPRNQPLLRYRASAPVNFKNAGKSVSGSSEFTKENDGGTSRSRMVTRSSVSTSSDEYAPSDEDIEKTRRGRPRSLPLHRSRASAPVNFKNARKSVSTSSGSSNKQCTKRNAGDTSRTRMVTRSIVSTSSDEDLELIRGGTPRSSPLLRPSASASVNFKNAGYSVSGSLGWSNKQLRTRNVGGTFRTHMITSSVSTRGNEEGSSGKEQRSLEPKRKDYSTQVKIKLPASVVTGKSENIITDSTKISDREGKGKYPVNKPTIVSPMQKDGRSSGKKRMASEMSKELSDDPPVKHHEYCDRAGMLGGNHICIAPAKRIKKKVKFDVPEKKDGSSPEKHKKDDNNKQKSITIGKDGHSKSLGKGDTKLEENPGQSVPPTNPGKEVHQDKAGSSRGSDRGNFRNENQYGQSVSIDFINTRLMDIPIKKRLSRMQ